MTEKGNQEVENLTQQYPKDLLAELFPSDEPGARI